MPQRCKLKFHIEDVIRIITVVVRHQQHTVGLLAQMAVLEGLVENCHVVDIGDGQTLFGVHLTILSAYKPRRFQFHLCGCEIRGLTVIVRDIEEVFFYVVPHGPLVALFPLNLGLRVAFGFQILRNIKYFAQGPAFDGLGIKEDALQIAIVIGLTAHDFLHQGPSLSFPDTISPSSFAALLSYSLR